MVTKTDNRQVLEEMIRQAERVKDPGLQLGDIIQEGDDSNPPMVISTLVSAGYVAIYDTQTAERSIINKNMLTTKLRQNRTDGSPIFTTIRPSFAPKRGSLKCLLHPSSPNRAEYDLLGFGTCKKENLTSPMQVELHMQHCHKTEWRTIQREKEEKEKREERELRIALLGKAVVEKENPKSSDASFLCEECSKRFKTHIGLLGHKRSHQTKANKK